MPTPRIFLIRHGETEWSLSGRYTGATDIPLTARGEQQVASTAGMVIGPGKLIDAARLIRAFISPRVRAQRTFQIMFGPTELSNGTVETCEDVREWEYGAYEGLLTHEIRTVRKERGLDQDKPWDIWRDGCEGGESADEVAYRLDNVIQRIKALQEPHLKDDTPADIVIVAHGHILRAFVKRWLQYPLHQTLRFILEPGGVGVMTYDHKSIDEPAMLAGISLPMAEQD